MRKLLCGVAALGLSASVHAAPMFYTSSGAFNTDTSAFTMYGENFNGISRTYSAFSYDGASGLNISSNARMRDRQNNSTYCAGSSDCIYFSTPSGGSSQTFSFDQGAVNAFGLRLGDLATTGSSTLTLTTSLGDAMSWTFPDQPRGTDKFFGVIDSMSSFVSLTLTNSDRGDAVGLDNIKWGKAPVAVPEPSSLALLGLGLAGLGLSRRRLKA